MDDNTARQTPKSSQDIQRDLKLMQRLGRLERVLFFNRFAPHTGAVVHNRRYGEVEPSQQSLDIVLPRCGTGWPVLVFIHGGGFSAQDKDSYLRLAKVFAHHGYLVCNIDYRLAPRWKYPAQLEDVAEAMRWCWEHVRDLGGDRKRILLAGDSAGAYLASSYAAALSDPRLMRELDVFQDPPVKKLWGLLLFYGLYDLEEVADTGFPLAGKMARDFLGSDPEGFHHRALLASPLRHVGPAFPPTFLCSSDLDPLHPQSMEMDRALTAAGVKHKSLFLDGREYRNAYHGFLVYWNRRASRLVMDQAVQFMDGLK